MLSIFACSRRLYRSRFGQWKKNPQLFFGNFLGESILAFFNECSALKDSAPPARETTRDYNIRGILSRAATRAQPGSATPATIQH
jgi:hypothetical protein